VQKPDCKINLLAGLTVIALLPTMQEIAKIADFIWSGCKTAMVGDSEHFC
jgi:hypothetical protein